MASLDALYHEAIDAGRSRDYDRAVELLNELLAADESQQHPLALLYLGRSYHALGDYPRAVQALHAYQQLVPDSAPGHFFMGRSLLALGLRAAAMERLQRSIELHPDLQAAHALLGVCHLRNRNTAAALESLEHARSLNPAHRPTQNAYHNALIVHAIGMFHRGQPEQASLLLEAAIDDGHDHVMARVYLSRIYRELGNLGRALHHLEAAAQMAPDDPSLPLQRALLLSLGGDNEGALAQLGQVRDIASREGTALTTEPLALMRVITSVLFGSGRYRQALYFGKRYLREQFDDVDIHLMMAECHRNLGALRKARNHLERALERDRTRLDVRYAKVLTLWQGGNFRRVLRELDAIRRLAPDDDGAAYSESLCRHELADQPEEVIPLIQEQLRQRGKDLPLMTALGQEYLRIDLADLATGWLERSLAIQPDHQDTLRALISAQQRTGDAGGAHRSFSRYLQLQSGDNDVRERFIAFLLEQQEWGEAANEIVQVMPHRPDDLELKRQLAACYRHSRRYAEAIVLYRELLAADLDSNEMLGALLDCLEKSRNRRYAISLLERVLKRTPGRGDFAAQLGRMQMREGDLERATETLRRAVADQPQSWQAHHHLGLAYKRLGNTEFAERYRKRANQLRAAAAPASKS